MSANKQTLVENNLRFKALLLNQSNQTMNIIERMNYYNVKGVSIAVIANGKIDWADVYGIADSENNQALTTNTLFQSGSISKSIAALGILVLVQQGIISLDENINHYLKSWHLPENDFTVKEKVTLRKILSHTAGLSVSGFPGYEADSIIPSISQILDGIKPPVNTDPVRVIGVPGVKWSYSGGGTTIAQLLIEDVTGQPFEIWMQQNILNPLGMTNSTFNQYPEKKYPIASAYDSPDKRVKGLHHIYPEMAAAGLWSTPTDLAKFLIFIQNTFSEDSHFLRRNLIREILKPQIHAIGKLNAGLGVFLQSINKEIIFEHGGQDCGFISLYRGLIHQKCGFVIMMNAGANGWYLMEEISNSIMDCYKWNHFSPIYHQIFINDKKLYPKFSGIYFSKENEGKIIITEKNNKLFLKEASGMPAIELHPKSNFQFFTQEGNHILEFNNDEPSSLIMTDNNEVTMKYKRSQS